ncbi:MAG: hypothetical protein PHE93_06430, partial [Clostridia bacterium]|nr:hypothetical protein [Clostridia bacterium]
MKRERLLKMINAIVNKETLRLAEFSELAVEAKQNAIQLAKEKAVGFYPPEELEYQQSEEAIRQEIYQNDILFSLDGK